MHSFRRALTWLGIAALGVAFIWLTRGNGGGPGVGEPAPSFTASTLSGETFDLADHEGQVVVLDFWAHWCPPCVRSFPGLEAAYQRLKDDPDVLFATVNTDAPGDQRNKVPAFVKRRGLTLPVIFDPGGKISQLYKVKSLPTLVVIAQDGRVHYVHAGMLAGSKAGIEKKLLELVEAAKD